MKLTKILSALLCFAMLFALVSCSIPDLNDLIGQSTNNDTSGIGDGEPNWEEELKKEELEKEESERNEQEGKEEENVEIVAGSVEYYLQEIGKAMANAKVKITTAEARIVNGNNINITTVCYYDGSNFEQEETYGIKIMCVDDTIYYSSSLQGIKNKLPNAAENGYKASSSIGINESNGGINAYASKTVIENSDGTITIRLEGASDSFKELMGASTPDEQVQEITFDASYRILSDNTHQTTAGSTVDRNSTYSYDDARDITIPDDADEYNEVSSLNDLYY